MPCSTQLTVSVQTITWMPGRCTGLVKLTLFRNGVSCGVLAKNIPASAAGTTWRVGTNLAIMLTAGSGYSMQLSSMDNSFSDSSDTNFSLAAAGLSRLPAKAYSATAGVSLVKKPR